jgi:hypothetical protein
MPPRASVVAVRYAKARDAVSGRTTRRRHLRRLDSFWTNRLLRSARVGAQDGHAAPPSCKEADFQTTREWRRLIRRGACRATVRTTALPERDVGRRRAWSRQRRAPSRRAIADRSPGTSATRQSPLPFELKRRLRDRLAGAADRGCRSLIRLSRCGTAASRRVHGRHGSVVDDDPVEAGLQVRTTQRRAHQVASGLTTAMGAALPRRVRTISVEGAAAALIAAAALAGCGSDRDSPGSESASRSAVSVDEREAPTGGSASAVRATRRGASSGARSPGRPTRSRRSRPTGSTSVSHRRRTIHAPPAASRSGASRMW